MAYRAKLTRCHVHAVNIHFIKMHFAKMHFSELEHFNHFLKTKPTPQLKSKPESCLMVYERSVTVQGKVKASPTNQLTVSPGQLPEMLVDVWLCI